VRSQRLLPVGDPLHGAQSGPEVPTHAPPTPSFRPGQTHAFQRSQSRHCELVSWICRIPVHAKELCLDISRAVACDHSVERRESVLEYLASLCLEYIVFSAVPKLPGTQILRNAPNSTFHVVAIEAEWLAVVPHASKSHVDVRVVGIEMADRYPLEPGPEVLLHLLHQAIGQTLQVGAVAEFRRDDEFPKALVFRFLPLAKPG
jgi:hypothetical protein